MLRKYLVLILLGLALVAVLIVSSFPHSQHGDPQEWMRKHGKVVMVNRNPQRNCIKCHSKKRGETMENFCNKCHREKGVKTVEELLAQKK